MKLLDPCLSSCLRNLSAATPSRRCRVLGRFGRAAALLAALFCLGSAAAWAASCTVSSTADDGSSGTLRYCLNNLDSGSAATTNTITFSVTGTISLTGSLPAINNGVTIAGLGANQLTISGGGQYQIMSMGNSSSPVVRISGLNFANGFVNSGAYSGGQLRSPVARCR